MRHYSRLAPKHPATASIPIWIITANDARASAFLTAILQTTPGAAGLTWPKREQLNLLLVPMQAATKDKCNAVTAGSLTDCAGNGLVEALHAYDYEGARTFIYRMCQKSPPHPPAVCAAGARVGPYLFTYRQPASAMEDFQPPFLFVDLSSIDPAAFGEYYAAYKEQVQSNDPTGDDRIHSLRLKILDIVLSGRGLIIPVKEAVAEILKSDVTQVRGAEMQKIASAPVLILLIALAVGIGFHFLYPSVPIDAGLYAAFALAGTVVYLGAAALLGFWRKTDRAPGTPE